MVCGRVCFFVFELMISAAPKRAGRGSRVPLVKHMKTPSVREDADASPGGPGWWKRKTLLRRSGEWWHPFGIVIWLIENSTRTVLIRVLRVFESGVCPIQKKELG